jgi:hypothetical protein
MTVKVYLNDGSIEEYPNAYIYWEWDESENGTSSGFRINSMDRNFTSAVAFVYPGDCTKIEITSEKCDRVFKSPPREAIIPVKRWKIFKAIHEEHIRQDEKWGEQNHKMISTDQDHIPGLCRADAENLRAQNERFSKNGRIGWDTILLEEVYEVFAETEPVRQRAKMVQVAAVAVQIIEYLDRRLETEKSNDKV